jgi:hypothetical protein
MAAGVVRIIEVCFVLNDGPSPDGNNIRIFQYLTPYVSAAQASVDAMTMLMTGFVASSLAARAWRVSLPLSVMKLRF